jgi:hypothetical protein
MTLCNAVSAENSKRSVLNMDLGQACEVVLSPFFSSIQFSVLCFPTRPNSPLKVHVKSFGNGAS